jgi:quercetin dioxygenase-like cupin family protein
VCVVQKQMFVSGSAKYDSLQTNHCGSVTLEVEGKPPVTLKAGEAFTTSAGEVHNVKNANKTAPVKALAFYVAKKGARMEDLAVPAK